MTPLNIDFDRLSDADLTDLVKGLCRQYLSRPNLVHLLEIPGDGERPLGFLTSVPPKDLAEPDPEFLAELRHRVANPPDRYLTVDEFLEALDDYWAKCDLAAQQLHSANGHADPAG
jgi:hypothetical protein